MTKEELLKRIEKKQADIAKIEKRIAKWTTGMNEEAKKIVADCELIYDDPKLKSLITIFREYKQQHANDPTVYNSDWNKGPQIDEAYSAYRDLAENKETLNKYIKSLNELDNFNNMEKIKPIWDFLQNWRQTAYEYFIKNAEEYYQLKLNEENAREKYFEENPLPADVSWREEYRKEQLWRQAYYDNIHSLTKNLYLRQGKLDIPALNKKLDAEVRAKYDNLVAKVTKITGKITDASNLRIGHSGDINGIIIGENGKARIETIYAGGYNIQCLHFRCLVHEVK